MAICKEKVVNFLNGKGYNIVRLPRTGIEPLDVIGYYKGKPENLGSLRKVWKSSVDIGSPSDDRTVNINGERSDKLKLSIGLKLLSDMLSGLGVTAPKVEGVYSRASTLQFSFANVLAPTYDPFDVGNYLAEGDLNTSNDVVRSFFLDETREALIIFQVLKTAEITVEAFNEQGTETVVELDVAKALAGAKVNVVTGSTSKTSLTYVSTLPPVTFAFKCLSIWFEEGRWRVDFDAQERVLSGESRETLTNPAGPVIFARGLSELPDHPNKI